jgi:hypothetical protein
VLDEDAYRIYDYFLLFPFDISVIRHRGNEKKSLSKEFEYLRPYKWRASPASTFLQLTDYQNIALRMLKMRGLIEPGRSVKLTENSILEHDIITSMDEFLFPRLAIVTYLMRIEEEYGLYGDGGLKDRSTLMTFKYDVKRDAIIN